MTGNAPEDIMNYVYDELLKKHSLGALLCIMQFAGGEVEARYQGKGLFLACWLNRPKEWPEKCMLSWGENYWFSDTLLQLFRDARLDGKAIWEIWEDVTDLSIN